MIKSFEKFYKSRNPKERKTIDEKIEILKDNPYDFYRLDIKKLKGYNKRYRLRIGNYRILYEIFDDIVVVILLDGDSRGGIYK